MRSLQLGWLGIDHELIVFPHPDLILNVNRRAGQKHWFRGPVPSYVIEHPDGLLLWDTGDALYTHESYGPPPAGSPLNPDPLGWAASVEKLRSIAREHEALVLPGHSETGIRQHRDRADLTSAPTPGLVYE